MGANDEQQVTTSGGNFLRGAQGYEHSVVFFVLAEKACLAFFQDADNFKVVPAHPHLSANDVTLLSREKRVRTVNAKHHYVRALLVVQLANESPFFQGDVGKVRVICRNSLGIAPTVIVAFVSNIVVERPTAITNIWR